MHAHSHGQTPSEVYSDLFSRRDQTLFHTKVDESAPQTQNVNLRTDLELTDTQRLADKAGRVRAHLDGQTPVEVEQVVQRDPALRGGPIFNKI